MKSCTYTYNGVTYSQPQLVKLMYDELTNNPLKYPELTSLLLKATTLADLWQECLKINREGSRRNSTNGWIGVSDYLELKHNLTENPGKGQFLIPIYNKDARIENTIALEIASGNKNSEEDIRNELLALISDEELGNNFGTLFHELVGTGCEKGINSEEYKQVRKKISEELVNIKDSNGKSLYELIIQDSPIYYSIDQVMSKIDDISKDVVSYIQLNFPESLVLNEMHMSSPLAKMPMELKTKYQGLKGRADLVLISKDGTINIIDFKVATRKYNDWFAAKKYHTEYQLGFYRQLLAANGINPKLIKLFVLPIYFERGNIENLQRENLINLLTPTTSRFSHLDLESGEFTSKIQDLLPVTIKINIEESSDLVEKIQEDFTKMVSYDPIKKNYGKEDFVKRFIDVVKENGKISYVFKDWLSRKTIKKDSLEEFTKEGGIIDQFNAKLKKLTAEQTRTIADDIKKQKGKNPGNEGYDFLNEKNHTTAAYKILAHTFGAYTDPVYQMVDAPALTDLGILAFENTDTGVINFVVITDQNLDARVDNRGQSSVLGNFISNDKARNLSFDPMDSNCGNMELLKVLHSINVMKQNYPDKFVEKKIGTIEAINIHLAQQRIANSKNITDNYSYLTGLQGIFNNFNNGSIQFADYFDQVVGYLRRQFFELYLVEDESGVKKIVDRIKWDAKSKNDKLRTLKLAILDLKRTYKDFNFEDFKSSREKALDELNPISMLYVLLNEAYTYYLDIPVDYRGELQKYGIQFSEVIRLLEIPFISDQSTLLKNGYTTSGPLNGVEVSSPVSVPSETLRAVYQYFDIAFIKVRTEFQNERAAIQDITRDYIMKKHSQLNRFLINDTENIWRDLLVKDANGNLSKSLSLRDPYTDKTLTEDQREFLKAALWEINKYQLDLSQELKELHYPKDKNEIELAMSTESSIITAMSNGSYFYLPLRRASDFQRLKNLKRVGLSDWFDKKWDAIKEDYDPRNLSGAHRQLLDNRLNENTISMYNAYEEMSGPNRMQFIEEQGVNDFEVDLDYLISDVAFLSIRKKCFEDVLLVADATATTLHFILQTTDMTYQTELDALDDQMKVDTGKSLIGKEQKELAGAIGSLKRLNSLIVLAIRPLQFLKELTYGLMTNYSRAWALKYSSSSISAKSVFNANKVIWGLSLRKYGNAFSGEGDIADYTMCEAINKQYGIANEDLNRTVDNSTLQRTGITHNFSRWMYIANSAPDYFNRLTLFIAKMMEDGCFDAHSLSSEGTIVYDFKKDKRFSEIHKYGWNSTRTDEKYLNQKALFRAMASDFEREGFNLITVVNGEERIKDLPRAYTIKQRNSIKEVADLAYGFYDHEAKSLIDHKFLGLVWKQFMTFLTAKTTLWFRGRPTSEGSNTSQGKFVHLERIGRDGKMHKMYRYINELGNLEIRSDEDLTPEQIRTLEPQYEWKGDYVEGLAYSIMGIFHDILHFDFEHLKNDKLQLGNLKLALHDLLMGYILYSILKFIFSKGTNKTKDVHPMARTVLRAMLDIGPQSMFTSLNWEPGFATTLENLQADIYRNFNEGIDFEKTMRRFGSFSDFMWS